MKSTFALFLVLSLIAFSCKKEQPQPNNGLENCSCAHEVSADFTIEEIASVVNDQYLTETDLIFGNKNVRFYAKENNAQYTWYIGSEVLTTQEVKRYFANSLVGQTIPISLVVKKSPNSICFPNDDGYDSITKYFTVAQFNLNTNYDTTFLEGIYRVKSPLLSDSVDIIIDYKEYASGMDKCWDIYNYNGYGENIQHKIFTPSNYRQFWIEDLGSWLHHLEGDVHIRTDNVVEMNFLEREYNGIGYDTTKRYLYRGRKL